jgi:pimeloyl-ACP methyl ester carboxylesterase
MPLHYRQTGEGQPVVILHGLFGSSDNWRTFALEMAEKRFSVFAVDLRNHGRSPHYPEHTYPVMASEVIEFISTTIGKPVALMGHSMGGKTAMQAALDYPDQVQKLIVLDISPAAYPVLHADILEALSAIDLDSITTRQQAHRLLARHIHNPAILQLLLKGLYYTRENRLQWRFNLHVLQKEIQEIGKAIQADVPYTKPVLFIRGEKSNYVSDEHRMQIQALFPQSEILTAPQAGHWIHADNPAWLLNTVTRFLSDQQAHQ